MRFFERIYYRMFPNKSYHDALNSIRHIIDTRPSDLEDKIDNVLIEVDFFPSSAKSRGHTK